MWTLRNLYHSIPLTDRIPTHPVPTRSDHWLKSYPYFCTLVPWASTFKLLATGCYRHADTSRPIPFNSPHGADSNKTLPDSGRHLAGEVSALFSLLTSIAMRTLRNLFHSIPLNRRIPTHPVPTLSAHWLKAYSHFCPLVLWPSTLKLFATECYRNGDTSKPIRFNSSCRVDSNKTLPDSGGHLPGEVSAFFSLLTTIAMPTLRNRYHSIPLNRRIPTHPIPMLPDRWLKSYLYLSTPIPLICTFQQITSKN